MKLSSKIVMVVTVVVAIAVVITAYGLLNSALVPLDQKQDITTTVATKNVEIQATTFNGDIVIESTTSNQIEVTYDITAPQGHLGEITTTTTNQTINENTKLVAEAKIQNNGIKVNYRATLTIKLPSTSQYNLSMSTLNGNIIKPLLNDVRVEATTSNGYVDIKDDNATSIAASTLNGNVNIHLSKGTLFQVDANTANGHITYQGIAMNTNIQTTTHLQGNTTDGLGHLNLTLSSANGNVTIEYFMQNNNSAEDSLLSQEGQNQLGAAPSENENRGDGPGQMGDAP
jgi:DUF4097 and DUF4098 domain-containing protein YvlB